MKYRRREARDEQGIDISPLIDMVFILLIFFMVSTTFIKNMDLDINRPKATTAQPSSPKALRIYIDSSGQTYLQGQPVQTWVIQSRLKDLLEVSTSGTVLVVTDGNVPAQKLIAVVDQARLAGAADVAVATEREAGGRRS